MQGFALYISDVVEYISRMANRGRRTQNKTKDIDVRTRLIAELRTAHRNAPDTKFVHELGLCQHQVRADYAVVNGELCGFEIKSDSDTLRRLPMQAEIYSRVFDRMTVVCGKAHLEKVRKIVPKWWGISIAVIQNQAIAIRRVRSPKLNPAVDPYAVIQLLWRTEAEKILRQLGQRGLSALRINQIWSLTLETLSTDDLRYEVREAIKARENWRSDQRRNLRGGSRRPAAKSLHFPAPPIPQPHSRYIGLPN